MLENSVFSVLNAVDCSEHVEKKGKPSYLSWAWAWREVKSHYPDASYTIYESPDGWNYFTDSIRLYYRLQGDEMVLVKTEVVK